MEDLWSCIWCNFFLYPKNLDTIKYSKLTTFFIILYVPPPPPTPPPPPRKNLVPTALYENLEIDFSINLNKYFWTVILSKLHYFFVKISTYCKTGSRYVVAMPLHQSYCLTCFYSCIKFYCPKVRWSWSWWGKKVLFDMIKAWYYLEYVFNSLKLNTL